MGEMPNKQPNWYWLLPVSYVIHIAEEYFGGFVEWSAHITGSGLGEAGFLAATSAGAALTLAGIYLSGRSRRQAWIPIAMAVVFVLNSLLHFLQSALTHSYSPGLASGLLIWLPLGLAVLRRAFRDHSRSLLLKSAAAGALIQAAISLTLRLS